MPLWKVLDERVHSESDRDTADRDQRALKCYCECTLQYVDDQGTYDAVVLAAHGLCAAGAAAANTDDGDGGAIEADKCIDVLHYNAD